MFSDIMVQQGIIPINRNTTNRLAVTTNVHIGNTEVYRIHIAPARVFFAFTIVYGKFEMTHYLKFTLFYLVYGY